MAPKSVLSQHPALVAIGSTIRSVRLEQGLTQEMLAHIADVDRGYMSRIERGDNNVALITLLKICKALDTSLDELAKRADL